MSRRPRPNAAVRAEPRGIGSAGARDPLALEVRLLGALLGQVIVEQAGIGLLELVERIRRRRIQLRRDVEGADRQRLEAELEAELSGLDPDRIEVVIRAFGLYFQLVNLAEERHRVRTLRRRERGAGRGPGGGAGRGVVDGSVAEAVERLREAGHDPAAIEAFVRRLSIAPVLTAHPTEARRRTLLVALRRCARLIERLDDPRLTPAEDADIRRRLREAITLLWHTAEVRSIAPTPLDEVRTAMVFFDETLFTTAPRVYRALDGALDRVHELPPGAEMPATDTGRTGTRPPLVPAFLRWGSWVGGDRDGNPNVTAETTLQAIRIQADHVLRGYEAVAARLMATVSAAVPRDRLASAISIRLAGDEEAFPETMRSLRRRFEDEPYRQRLGAIAERLRRTRAWLTGAPAPLAGRYGSAEDLIRELDELQVALVADGLARVAWGEIQDLRWQVETFGFHLASLEVRQHAAVHRAALERLAGALAGTADRTGACDTTGTADTTGAADRPLEPRALLALATEELVPGVTPAEVVATFRAIAAIQARFGEEACHRYVISFTASAADVTGVLELARLASAPALPPTVTGGFGPASPVLDVVPLFESAEALAGCAAILEALFTDPAYRAHLRARGDRQEVMLGYSDSNKESGFLAANWMLHQAQSDLVEVTRRHGLQLTVFHGRGGAIGRGGGPTNRAIRALAPGSLDGRLKLTEQGEVIAAHYADATIARRELEQMTNAVLAASTPEHEARLGALAAEGRPIMDELAERARVAYRALVWDEPEFARFFRDTTPISEISALRLGSRPAARGRLEGERRDRGETAAGDQVVPSLADLRAIPWVFAWSQSRLDLPGWYGLGSALEGYRAAHGDEALAALGRLYRRWPFLESVLDNAELILARADLGVARRYASLARWPEARRLMETIEDEYRRSVTLLLRVTGHGRLLDRSPALQRSIALRNPYVDPLSDLQVRLLERLRGLPADDPERPRLLRLVQLTVNGVAAGLQSTG